MMAGQVSMEDYLQAVPRFAAHPAWDVAVAPLARLSFMLDHLVDGQERMRAQQFSREIYSPLLQRIGLSGTSEADRAHPDETAQLRNALVPFLALKARDEALRKELAVGGRSLAAGWGNASRRKDAADVPFAHDPSLRGVAMAVAAQEDGKKFAELLRKRLKSKSDLELRGNILAALAQVTDASLTEWVSRLALSTDLEPGEAASLLGQQAAVPGNLRSVWAWQKAHFKALTGRVTGYEQRQLIALTGEFCDASARRDVEATVNATAEAKDGMVGLEPALEQIDHCVAMAERHGEAARRFFAAKN